MCGIAGIRRYGDNPITPEEIKLLLLANEHRGNHATGIAIQNRDAANDIYVHKMPTPAHDFIATKQFQEFLRDHLTNQTQTVLLHTRAATVGSPYQLPNNHPIYAGETAVVHNGHISNHDYMFKELKLERRCETDSDIIRAILDAEGLTHRGVTTLARLCGSGAIVAIRRGDLDHVLLARSGNPLVYGWSDTNEKLYWASEIQAIQRAARPWRQRLGLYMRDAHSDLAYFHMPDNTAYLMGPNALEWRKEMVITTQFRAPIYRVNDNYQERMSRWHDAKKTDEGKKKDEEAAKKEAAVVWTAKGREYGVCPNEACSRTNVKRDISVPWGAIKCFKCGENMGELDKCVL